MFPTGYNLKIGGTVFQHTEESRSRLSVSGLKYFEKKRLEKYKDVTLPEDIKDYDKDLMEKYSAAIQLLAGEKISKYVTADEYALEFAEWLLKDSDLVIIDIKDLLTQFKKEVGYDTTTIKHI